MIIAKANESLKSEFDIYLATPLSIETHPTYKKSAIFCEKIPGRSVCMSEKEYRKKRGIELKFDFDKKNDSPIVIKKGFNIIEIVTVGVGAFAIGYFTNDLIKALDSKQIQ